MSDVPLEHRGLVIVQIDGLSYHRMQKALAKRRLPYLRKLIRRGTLKVHPYLSQIPTSTPAFQGGMFYGNNDNIPGFNFYDKREQRLYRMGESECAFAVQSQFTNPGLLRHGSVFSCVYTGDAEASLFIFSSLLAPRRWKFALRVWDLAMLTFLHIETVVKIIALAILEFFVAIWDFLRRIRRTGRVRKELETIAVRIGLSLISRELITLGAVIDIYRQVPIIYINFLSYDEHAHQRGPNSAFATWGLRAIDRSIKRIHLATRYSARKYDLYVMSDHGQSACRPFEQVAGEPLASFLEKQLAGLAVDNHPRLEERAGNVRLSADATNRIAQTAPWFLRDALRQYSDSMRGHLPQLNPEAGPPTASEVTVVSTGPIAYAYWTRHAHKLNLEEIELMHPGIVERLVAHPCIGCISAKMSNGDVFVQSNAGFTVLSRSGVKSSQGSMPFDHSIDRQHVVDGIWRVTLMQRSGDLCLWGGNTPKGDISFTFEFGCHSGWTDEEIRAFIMSPPEADIDLATIRQHPQFYSYFRKRYCGFNACSTSD